MSEEEFTMKVWRVVTGHSPESKAIFASDEQVEPIRLEKLQGNDFHELWGGDAVSVPPPRAALPEGVTPQDVGAERNS